MWGQHNKFCNEIMTCDIYAHGNRVSVTTDSKIVTFVVWNMDDNNKQSVVEQLNAALNICKGFDDIEKQMNINGFDCELEDINNL